MNFKDKKVLGIVAGVVVLLLVVGVVFAMRGNNASDTSEEDESASENIPSLSKEELGLQMELSPDNKKVKFSIAKASDISHVECEITYDADSTEDESVKVPKGITCDEDVKGNSFETKLFDLGTCSKNVCRYDTGVEEVKLLVKVTKKDGKVYQSVDSLKVTSE